MAIASDSWASALIEPKAHGTGSESLDDILSRIRLRSSRDRRRPAGAKLSTDRAAWRGFVFSFIDVLSELPVCIFIVRAYAQRSAGWATACWVPHMGIAVATPMEITWVRQHRQRNHVSLWEAEIYVGVGSLPPALPG